MTGGAAVSVRRTLIHTYISRFAFAKWNDLCCQKKRNKSRWAGQRTAQQTASQTYAEWYQLSLLSHLVWINAKYLVACTLLNFHRMRAPLVERDIKVVLIFNNGLCRLETSETESVQPVSGWTKSKDVKHMRIWMECNKGRRRTDGEDGDDEDDDNQTVFHSHKFAN